MAGEKIKKHGLAQRQWRSSTEMSRSGHMLPAGKSKSSAHFLDFLGLFFLYILCILLKALRGKKSVCESVDLLPRYVKF